MVLETSHIETIPILNEPDGIHVGFNLLDYIAADLMTCLGGMSNYVIITDNNLAPLYLNKLMIAIQSRLTDTNQRLLTRILPSGEQSKSRDTKASIEDYLLDASCTRDTCLIALGGGVMGDLVGYVASTFMRGVPFVQIPTTLLAMVDSSIGGKTAIDTPRGKNLIGTFWQPKRIYLDLAMLETLPSREFANGMAEVIKTAAISSETEFIKLENGKDKIVSAIIGPINNKNQSTIDSDRKYLANVISAAARFKADVVTLDEREGGLRGLLNFGHSIGHAYEASLSPAWLHGECVSIGLLHEAELSRNLGHCSEEVIERLKNCLELYNLPIQFDSEAKEKLTVNNVMSTMKVDKKNKGTQKRIVLLSLIGKTLEQKASNVPDAAIENVISKYISIDSSSGTINEKLEIEPDQIPAVSLNLVASTNSLISLVRQLSRALNEKFGNSLQIIERDEHRISCINKQASSTTSFYFTEQAGTTCPLDKDENWFEYVLLPKQSTGTTSDVLQFIDNVTGRTTRHISPKRKTQSTFITPTVSNYDALDSCIFQQWIENTDAIEFRVDHLLPPSNTMTDWLTTTGNQLFSLRQLTNLPIVYTVRTLPQAGKFDPSLAEHYKSLVHWGHRWGCDYVDLEITTIPANELDSVMQLNQYYPFTKLIASFHDPNHKFPWSSQAIMQIYDQASQLLQKYNHTGVVKLVGYANSFWDNIELEQFRHRVDPDNEKEIILINMGSQGKFSRAANHFLSPATHPTLPFPAAPGQLSIMEMASIRKRLDMDV